MVTLSNATNRPKMRIIFLYCTTNYASYYLMRYFIGFNINCPDDNKFVTVL